MARATTVDSIDYPVNESTCLPLLTTAGEQQQTLNCPSIQTGSQLALMSEDARMARKRRAQRQAAMAADKPYQRNCSCNSRDEEEGKVAKQRRSLLLLESVICASFCWQPLSYS